MKKISLSISIAILTLAAVGVAGNFTYTVPTAGVTPGPTWASQISTALTLLKTHTHDGTANEGPQISVGSLSADATLNLGSYGILATTGTYSSTLSVGGTIDLNDQELDDVDALIFNDSTGVPSTYPSLYPSSGDLYYKEGSAGTAIQVTAGAYLNANQAFPTTKYVNTWGCTNGGVTSSSSYYLVHNESTTPRIDVACPVPVIGTGASSITQIDAYFTTSDSNCDVDSYTFVYDGDITDTNTPTVVETAANTNVGTGAVSISITTDVTTASTGIASLFITIGNDGGGNCDDFKFHGYKVTYGQTYGNLGAWNQ